MSECPDFIDRLSDMQGGIIDLDIMAEIAVDLVVDAFTFTGEGQNHVVNAGQATKLSFAVNDLCGRTKALLRAFDALSAARSAGRAAS